MFGNNLKATITSFEAIFKSAGFDFTANLDKPDSLKAFIEQREQAARTTATSEAGASLLKAAGLAAVEGKTADVVVKEALAARDATVAVYTAGLESAGVKPVAQKDQPLTAADIKTAVETRASQKAAATVAATGHTPIEQAAEDKGGKGDGATVEDLQARLAATKDPIESGKLAKQLNALRDKQWAN
jgi:hypothetical protein